MFENSFSVEELPLEAIRHERLRRLLAYWEAERQPEPWLAYSRLRPEEIAFVLSEVAVLERVEGNGQTRFVVRLAGEAIRWGGLGFVRGKTSDEFQSRWLRDHLVEGASRVFNDGTPSYAAVTVRCGAEVYDVERLFLPLVRRGPKPDCLLMAVVLPQPLIDLKGSLNSCLS